MKFTSKSAAIVAALAMATTGVLAVSNNETTADAATVATVHSGVTARLYTNQGKLITNRALAPSTPWIVGKIAQINGETMYQVSTNEYLKASDSDLSGQPAQSNTNKRVGKAVFTDLSLYRDDTNSMANRSLAKGSEWQIGKFIRNKNNQEFVQVSTHEYADAALMAYYVPMTNPTYIADFGTNSDFTVIKVGNGDIGNTITPSNPSTNTNTGSNTTAPSQNQDNNAGSTTTAPSTGTNTGSNSSSNTNAALPSTESVKAAVLAVTNKERAEHNVAAVSSDPTLDAIAAKRAKEISQNFTHYDANGTELYKTYLHAQTSYLSQGENLFLTPWDQLSVQSPQHYAEVLMDNYRGEGISTTWNHYSNVLNPDATMVGIGVYVASDGTIYTVQDYAAK